MRFQTFAIGMPVHFRGLERREGMLVRGDAGWGEFSPFADYDTSASQPWLAAALEAATQGWPEPLRERVPVNCTVPAVGPEQAAAIVRRSGCLTAKVKVAEVGQTLGDDIARLEAVRDALGSSGRIRIDANGAWTVDDAVAALRLMDAAADGLEYAEQPCATAQELAVVRRQVDLPIAADESIRRVEDPLRVKQLEAADIAVLKVHPLGGVRSCLRLAEELGLPVVVSSAVETSVGLAAGVALAAALPDLPYACGLATQSLLAGDVTKHPLIPVDGHLEVRRVEVDEESFAQVAADAETDERWQRRLSEVSAHDRDR